MMTTGFTGGDTATGPTAGFDPVLKMRAKRKALKGLVAPGNKLSDGKKKIKENLKSGKRRDRGTVHDPYIKNDGEARGLLRHINQY